MKLKTSFTYPIVHKASSRMRSGSDEGFASKLCGQDTEDLYHFWDESYLGVLEEVKDCYLLLKSFFEEDGTYNCPPSH